MSTRGKGVNSLPRPDSITRTAMTMNPQDLKDWRTAQGLSQAEGAAILCISLANIQAYEQGARTIPDRVAKLAEYVRRWGDIGPPPYK